MKMGSAYKTSYIYIIICTRNLFIFNMQTWMYCPPFHADMLIFKRLHLRIFFKIFTWKKSSQEVFHYIFHNCFVMKWFNNFIVILCLPTRKYIWINSYKVIKNSEIQTKILDLRLNIHIAHKRDDVWTTFPTPKLI